MGPPGGWLLLGASIRTQIEEAARTLAFDQVGVVALTRPESADHFYHWLNAGHSGDMAYMGKEPERRVDPKVYWPEAKCAIMCVRSYAPEPEDDPEPAALEGKVARYARGRDYHFEVKKALHGLGKAVEKMLPGVMYRAVIDTSPFLDRAHAVGAGLGWVGKNTMVLSRQHGSFTFIGAVLLDRELPTDGPITDHCGSCTACLDACPTGALLEPYVLDSRRCISYLTIEYRGDFPLEHQKNTGHWLFGCDICQEVCPWVRKAGPGNNLGRLAAIGDRANPPLKKLLDFEPAEFTLWAQKSPMKRPKLEGMQRNAAQCLGNSPDRDEAVHILGHVIEEHVSPLVRRQAAQSLATQGGIAARTSLEKAQSLQEDWAPPSFLADLLVRCDDSQ